MKLAPYPVPVNEAERLAALARYAVLDSDREPSFDRITTLAARLFEAPIALISLLDESRQWFKSCLGLDGRETPREFAFCSYTILSNDPLIVTDAADDHRFSHNPLVTGHPYIRFYVGAPLRTADGFRLGSLCVIDNKPRPRPSERDLLTLQDLASQVVELLESFRIKNELQSVRGHLLEQRSASEERVSQNTLLAEQIDFALEAGQIGVWEWNPDLDILSRSAIKSRILGLTNPERPTTLGDWIERIHPEDRATTLQRLMACQRGEGDFLAEYRVVFPGNSVRWVSSRARRQVDSSHSMPKVRGISWDTTERRLSQYKITQSRKIESGNEFVSFAILRTDAFGTVLSCDERCREMFGVSLDNGVYNWLSFVHPDDLPGLIAERDRCVAQGVEMDFELRLVALNSVVHCLFMHLLPLRDAQGSLTGFIAALADITSKIEDQRRLESLQKLLQHALDTMQQRVFWKDHESRFQGCNRAFATDFGFHSPNDVIGRTDLDLVGDPALAQKRQQEDRLIMLAGESVLNIEETVLVENSPILIRKSKVPLRDSSGTIVGILGTYEDITEQTAKEQELKNAKEAAEEAARVKGQFLANMSHEIRTPLNGVLGMVSLLLDSSLAADQRQWAETAQVSGEALLRLLNNVLDLSKAEAGKLTVEHLPFNLARTVQQCSELFQAEAGSKGLALVVDYSPCTPSYVVGDPFRVRQILNNFIANAVKFTERGTITVAVSSKGQTTDSLQIRLAVTDTGSGVPLGAERNLFHAFSQADGSTTRKFGGTGLGLSIAKQLVELMNGSIGYVPNAGGGSIFWVEFPVGRAGDVRPEKTATVVVATGLKDRMILVAEDNPINQLVTSRFLSKIGCQVKIATNGREAVQLWQKEPFDLILMDGQMPELDGYGATIEVRKLERELERKRVPIVALTAHALPGDKERCLAAGMDDYISKPIQMDALRKILELWLQHAPEPATLRI